MKDDLKDRTSVTLGGVALKGLLLTAVCILIYSAAPLPVGAWSLYNRLLAGRDRFPQGSKPDEAYNFAIFDLDAMFASHVVSLPKEQKEYRILVIGDSSVWGVLLPPDETLSGRLNAAGLSSCDGRNLKAYNLGYAGISIAKDLLILDYAMRYHPDMVIWAVSLDSFRPDLQKDRPILTRNAGLIDAINRQYGLSIDVGPADPDTGVGSLSRRRRDLADLFRIQLYGVLWSATGIDEAYRNRVQPPLSDFDTDLAYAGELPPDLEASAFLFDAVNAGVRMAGGIPVLIYNEPIFVSQGRNSDLRYNEAYPRWAFDQYRTIMSEDGQKYGWDYVDLWNAVPSDRFSDTPFHLDARGEQTLANRLTPSVQQAACP